MYFRNVLTNGRSQTSTESNTQKHLVDTQVIKTMAEGSDFGHKSKGRSSWVTKAGTREVKSEEKYTTTPIPFVNDLSKNRWALL